MAGPPKLSFMQWAKGLISGKPHYCIGGSDNPYMLRWYLIPRNRWLNVYLHQFLRDDDDRALHDHPFSFVSVILRGGYIEWVPDIEAEEFGLRNVVRAISRRAVSAAFRAAEHRHCVELPKRRDGTPIPCWTLVITGPRVREWGFICGSKFVPWYEFVDDKDTGRTGKGCGD